MAERWRPVDDGDSGSPYRLCELVEVADEPDEPISAAALQAAGWTRQVHFWTKPNKRLADTFVAVETLDAIPGHLRVYVVLDTDTILFRGVRSMSQLAALVEMLGGAE